MSRIPESTVEKVVGEVSDQMRDPTFAQVAIGNFAQCHPDVGRFITAHLEELGGGEGVMHAVFHAEVIHRCFLRHLGRALTPIGFAALDAAASTDAIKELERRQPAVSSYVSSNVDQPPMQKLLALVALAIDDAC